MYDPKTDAIVGTGFSLMGHIHLARLDGVEDFYKRCYELVMAYPPLRKKRKKRKGRKGAGAGDHRRVVRADYVMTLQFDAATGKWQIHDLHEAKFDLTF